MHRLSELYEQAELALSQGNHARAEKYLREAVSLDPENGTLLAMLSEAVCEQHRYDEAADLAQRAVGVDPEDPYPQSTLTRALHRGQRYEESLPPAYELIRLTPRVAHSYLTAAASLYELERAKECLAFASQGLAIDGANMGCMHFRALALAQLKRSAEAREMVDHFMGVSAGEVLSHTAAGWVYWWLGPEHDAEAERHLRAAVRINPLSEWSHEGLGLVLMRKNDLAGAREHLEEALRLCPEMPRARAALDRLDANQSKN